MEGNKNNIQNREVAMVKRFSVLISLVLVAVLLTGCLTPKVNVGIESHQTNCREITR